MGRSGLACVALLLLFFMPALGIESTKPQWLDALQSPSLDSSGARAVRDLQVPLSDGLLTIESGWLFPFAKVGGRSIEFVFIGDATFQLIPPNDVEEHQLELFTSKKDVIVSVDSAIVVLGSKQLEDALAATDGNEGGSPPTDRATEIFDSWKESPEREVLGICPAILRILHGDPVYEHYALVRFDSPLSEHPLVFLIDPGEPEPMMFGQFVPVELDDVDRSRYEKYIRKQRRKGRFTAFNVKNLGQWKTWLASQVSSIPDEYGFDITHHIIDVQVAPTEEKIRGTSTIIGQARSENLRIVALSLTPQLVVDAVHGADGGELPFERFSGELYVELPEAVGRGDRVRLQVDYHGVVFNVIEKGIFSLSDTSGWYPDEPNSDRATFDVTFHWPKKYELLSSGKMMEEGFEGSQRWKRSVLDVPSLAFTFEVGAFTVTSFDAGDIEVTLAISKTSLPWERIARKHLVETIQKAMPFYEETFGDYPLDYLTVVTLPRGYSQGFLGFVSLSHYLLQRSRSYNIDVHDYTQRIETIAHELAHQWWGNKVGWVSYRDQWLSEALADYSAVQYISTQQSSKALYLRSHASGWRNILGRRMNDGEIFASRGPVVMGTRLAENYGGRTYSSIVYDKGSVVFLMLARTLQVDPFNMMLKELATRVNNRLISTETFIMAIERMSGIGLEEFAEQFIYGTGIPEIYYDYEFFETSDGYRITGTARQIAPATRAHRISKGEGGWTLYGSTVESVDIEDRFLAVPFQIQLDREISDDDWTTSGLGGQLLIEGRDSTFSLDIKSKPRYFWLDQRGEVLGLFYRRNDYPRRAQRYLAQEMGGDEAELGLLAALELPVYGPGKKEDLSKREMEREDRTSTARIYLELLEHYLREGRLEKAREASEEVESRYRGQYKNYYKSTRRICEAWINILEGDHRAAYRSLSDFLYLSFPRLETDTVADARRRQKFRQGRSWSGDAYALLAIAAHELDNGDVADRALEVAENRGVDVEVLKTLRAESP